MKNLSKEALDALAKLFKDVEVKNIKDIKGGNRADTASVSNVDVQ